MHRLSEPQFSILKSMSKINMAEEGLNLVTVKMPSIRERLCSWSTNEDDMKQCFSVRDRASIKYV